MFLTAILILVLIVTAIACAATTPAPKQAPAPTTAPAPAPSPEYGGILKIITSPGIGNLGIPGEPQLPGDPAILRCVNEFLINFDPKVMGNYVGELATGWKWSPDYKPADYDAKLSQAVAEPDPVKALAEFRELRKIITDDYCMVMPTHT